MTRQLQESATKDPNLFQRNWFQRNLSFRYNSTSLSNTSGAMGLILIFIYGAVVLMMGYTQIPLSKVLLPDSSNAEKLIVFVFISQTAGMAFSLFVSKPLLHHLNVRWITLIGFSCTFGLLLIIAYIDKVVASTSAAAGLGIFICASFLLGLTLGFSSPSVLATLGAGYRGAKRGEFLAAATALRSIGGGIIPLAASDFVIHAVHSSFESVRYFYFIAAGLAAVGIIASLLFNYQHQFLKLPSVKTGSKNSAFKGIFHNKQIREILIFCGILIFGFMVTQITASVLFNDVATHYRSDSDNWRIMVLQSLGLYFVIKGILGVLVAKYVLKYMKRTTYILISLVILAVGFGLILGGLLQYSWGLFLIAALLGLASSNVFAAIYSLAISSNPQAASQIGIYMNFMSVWPWPITQAILAGLWAGKSHGEISNVQYLAPVIFTFTVLIVMIGVAVGLIWYVKHNKLPEK